MSFLAHFLSPASRLPSPLSLAKRSSRDEAFFSVTPHADSGRAASATSKNQTACRSARGVPRGVALMTKVLWYARREVERRPAVRRQKGRRGAVMSRSHGGADYSRKI